MAGNRCTGCIGTVFHLWTKPSSPTYSRSGASGTFHASYGSFSNATCSCKKARRMYAIPCWNRDCLPACGMQVHYYFGHWRPAALWFVGTWKTSGPVYMECVWEALRYAMVSYKTPKRGQSSVKQKKQKKIIPWITILESGFRFNDSQGTSSESNSLILFGMLYKMIGVGVGEAINIKDVIFGKGCE